MVSVPWAPGILGGRIWNTSSCGVSPGTAYVFPVSLQSSGRWSQAPRNAFAHLCLKCAPQRRSWDPHTPTPFLSWGSCFIAVPRTLGESLPRTCTYSDLAALSCWWCWVQTWLFGVVSLVFCFCLSWCRFYPLFPCILFFCLLPSPLPICSPSELFLMFPGFLLTPGVSWCFLLTHHQFRIV